MKKYILVIIAVSMLSLAGCATNSSMDLADSTTQESTDLTTQNLSTTENSITIEPLTFPSDDYLKDLGESVTFSDGDEILITESGTYEFSGNYENSTITVNVNKDTDDGIVYIILNNANITSETSTPMNIIEAKDVVIVLEGENTVTQGEITTSDTEFPSAAIYSKADTVITGDGSLTVNTLYQDGINSRDDLIINAATIIVTAIEDGIVGKDLLAIREANITVDAGKDGLKTSNSEDLEKGNLLIVSGNFNITAENDAISSENALQIDDGNFNLYSGDGYVEVIKTPSSGPMAGDTDTGMGGGRGNSAFNQQNPDMNSEDFDPTQLPPEMNDEDFDPTQLPPEMNDEDFDPTQLPPEMNDEDFDPTQLPPEMNDEDFDPNSETGTNQTDDTFEESMKAIKAVNSITINDGTFNISAYEDAVHSDGSIFINGGDFTINAGDDAFTSINTTITNGTIIIENCFEGIEGATVDISGGDISITTDDDGINANDNSGGVTISGGDIEFFYGSGGDGIDSNGFYTQTGGDIVITATGGSDAMNAPLDVDGTVTMTGGTIVDENGDAVEATSHGDMGGMTPGGNRGGTMPDGFGDMTPENFNSNDLDSEVSENTVTA